MSAQPTEQVFTIKGLDCAGCARTVEGGVAQLPDVTACELNYTTERMRVAGAVSREAVISRVRELGYDVAEPEGQPAERAARAAPGLLPFLWSRGETRLALLGALLMLPGLLLHELLGLEAAWVEALAVVALALTIVPIARSAWRGLWASRELTINALMTIAAFGALVIGAYVEAGMVVVLFALGEALEAYTGARARHAISSLMTIVPATATRLRRHGEHTDEEQVAAAALRVGDLVLVRPGERLPIDGVVSAGASAVNQAPITGESRLVEKEPGAEVFGGSINGEASLELVVSRPLADSTLSRMIRLVEQAQERRAPVQRAVDRFARYYTPAVVALAALVAVAPPLLFGQPFWNPAPDSFGWLYRGLALLVVACPCALVISTPVSLISAISAAARAGVLIKGGAYLEALSRVRAVAFDKTGTLTAGRPTVVAVRSLACPDLGAEPAPCDACDEVLALAYAVERRSEHPLAHAITSASRERGLAARYPAAEGVAAVTGRGVVGLVGGREVLIASHRHFDAGVPHDPGHCAAATDDAAAGYTPVMVSAGGAYLGTITVADSLRASSRDAVARLRAMGLRAVVMLTGDQRATAERVGAALGVTDVRAELLPEQKVAAVEALQRQHGPLAMVGDGINDTPALASASVGVAIGGAHGGTGQAMETADVTLMSDDLGRLPFAIGLGRAAMGTVRANVAFSIAVKLVFLALVLAGAGTMWMAVLADVGAALIVTLNGMRLLGYSEGPALNG